MRLFSSILLEVMAIFACNAAVL